MQISTKEVSFKGFVYRLVKDYSALLIGAWQKGYYYRDKIRDSNL